MKFIKKIVFAVALLCAAIATEAHATDESIPQRFVQDIEDKIKNKITSSLWKHFDFRWKQLYLRLDGGWRKYSSKITGFTTHPKTSEVFGYGIGYRCQDYPMRFELSVQSNNFKSEEGTTSLKSKTQNFSFNLYRDFALPESVINRLPIVGRFSPYLTAGIGRAIHSSSQYTTTIITPPRIIKHTASLKRNSATSWSLGVGSRINLSPKLAFDVLYKHIDVGSMPSNTDNQTTRIKGSQYTVSMILSL
jgi:opacity protein-like surface antigen